MVSEIPDATPAETTSREIACRGLSRETISRMRRPGGAMCWIRYEALTVYQRVDNYYIHKQASNHSS